MTTVTKTYYVELWPGWQDGQYLPHLMSGDSNVANWERHMETARQLAAQCWCDEETKHIVVEPALVEAVAKRIARWMESAAQFSDGSSYYRGLLVKCGEALGEAAYTCDDGTKTRDVLVAKVPELVEELAFRMKGLEE